MRKLKLQVQMTVDGFIAGPKGEMEWMKFLWTEDITEYVREITKPVDTIILGKNLAQGFIPYWEDVAKKPDDPEYEGGIIICLLIHLPLVAECQSLRKFTADKI